MPEGSSAVRPTNDLYLYLFTEYVYVYVFFFILHVPLHVVILHAFFHLYNYCTKFVNNYTYFIVRWSGFFSVASNFIKTKCVYKFNKMLIVFPY